MSLKIVIPDVGDEALPVIELLVKAGDLVKKEDPIMILESDKATVEVPAPEDGIITAISVAVDDKVSTGTEVGEMDAAEESAGDSSTESSAPETMTEKAPAKPESASQAGATAIVILKTYHI